jgi:hypothetical protein
MKRAAADAEFLAAAENLWLDVRGPTEGCAGERPALANHHELEM